MMKLKSCLLVGLLVCLFAPAETRAETSSAVIRVKECKDGDRKTTKDYCENLGFDFTCTMRVDGFCVCGKCVEKKRTTCRDPYKMLVNVKKFYKCDDEAIRNNCYQNCWKICREGQNGVWFDVGCDKSRDMEGGEPSVPKDIIVPVPKTEVPVQKTEVPAPRGGSECPTGNCPASTIINIINSKNVNLGSDNSINAGCAGDCDKGCDKEPCAHNDVSEIVAKLNIIENKMGMSHWRDANGDFNSARLASDSVAAVVLGTAGGLITSSVIKRNQVSNGLEDINCLVGGQVIGRYGDNIQVVIR